MSAKIAQHPASKRWYATSFTVSPIAPGDEIIPQPMFVTVKTKQLPPNKSWLQLYQQVLSDLGEDVDPHEMITYDFNRNVGSSS